MKAVKDMMEYKGREVWSIASNKSVFEAIEMMALREVGALTVVDDGKRLVGIISERDFARKVVLQKKSSVDTRVADIMTKEVISVGDDHTVDECMALMVQRKIRHLPVVVNDELAGIIAVSDMMKFIIDEQESAIKELESYVMGETGGSG